MQIKQSLKKIYYIACSAAHLIGGFLSALSVVVSPVFPVITTVLFIIYEYVERLRCGDWENEEIKEYLIGFFACIIILIIL